MPRFKTKVEYVEAERWCPGDPEVDARLGIISRPFPLSCSGEESPRMYYLKAPMPGYCETPIASGDWVVNSGSFFRYAMNPGEFKKKFEIA